MPMNTVAVFESEAFNHTEPKDDFINLCCFGDDLARWLMGELAQRGFRIDERACGLLLSLFGGRHRNVGRSGLAAIEDVLSRSARVENLRWVPWKEFRDGGVLAA